MRTIPQTCHHAAYELFADQIPVLETTDGLLRAAVAISKHAFEDVDPDNIDDRLSALAETVRLRLHGKSVPAALAHLHHVLFDEEGFSGNDDDYYHPLNSHLPAVLESRRGIPVTLAIIYKVVAERVGLPVEGINAPGHFLVRVLVERRGMLVDPYFRGTVLTEREAFHRMEQATRRQVPRSPYFLRPATHEEWISRILANLQHIYASLRRFDDLAAMNELQELLSRGP